MHEVVLRRAAETELSVIRVRVEVLPMRLHTGICIFL